jgi:class 3 adenylate cyclase
VIGSVFWTGPIYELVGGAPDFGGAPLTAEPSARREERKVVAVVFADLVGFTARTERLASEDVRALLSPYHERLRTELDRFGGTVEKFMPCR